MSKKTVIVLGSDESVQIAAGRAREVNHETRIVVSHKTSGNDVSLDMDARTITFSTDGKNKKIGFDTLIYCAGIENRKVIIEGLSEDDIECASNLNAKNIEGKSAVVLGCGRDGISVSQKLKSAGLRVCIFEKSPRILPRNSFEIAQRALKALAALDIKVHLQEEIIRGEKLKSGGYKLFSSQGNIFEADRLISATGAKPVNELLTSAGALTTQDGTLYVDDAMCTTLSEIYACGEAVSPKKALSNDRHFRPSRSMIERGAQVAGANAARQKGAQLEKMHPCAGLEILKIGNTVFARTGLSEPELEQKKDKEDFVRATVTAGNELIRLYSSRSNRAIVGAEIVGCAQTACYIELISLFILKKIPADDLIDLDVPSPMREVAEHIRSALNLEFESVSGENIALWLAQNKDINWLDVGEKPSSILNLFQNAKHVPLKDLKKKLLAFSPENLLVLTSVSGRSAIEACRIFKKRGFSQVYQLEGGAQTLNLLLGPQKSNQEC